MVDKLFVDIEKQYSLNKAQVLFGDKVLKDINLKQSNYNYIGEESIVEAIRENYDLEISNNEINFTLKKLCDDLLLIDRKYNSESYKISIKGVEILKKHQDLTSYLGEEISNLLKENLEKQSEKNLKNQIDDLTIKDLILSNFQKDKWWLFLIINSVVTIIISIIVAIILKNYGLD